MAAGPLRIARPGQEKPPSQSGESHVIRVFRTLELLASGPRTAAEIAGMLGVNRSTALRLLTEIEQLGYVLRDPITKSYAIAPARFYPFISSHADYLDWSAAIDPILLELREAFGEAAIMGVPANGTMVYLAFFPSSHIITVRERLGTTRPMHCSALGKAYLSALDDRSLDSELASLNYQGGSPLAAQGPIELRRRLEETRKRGYAIDRNETIDGVSCVAIPARIGGTLIGAIGLSGPSQRISETRIAEMGKRLLQIAPRLGGSPL
ncbi:MAG TPA: IclR family transcriptional regulator [Acetobacteraceae bacterium]|jgi:DNA-binding IclR family transcriptional regulator|nr:IclR family transcriptional regulator [Acetobacteraceae bacterium]